MKIDLSRKLDICILVIASVVVFILLYGFGGVFVRLLMAFFAVAALIMLFDNIHKPPHGNTIEANNH